LLAFAGFTAFALSNTVYIGGSRLLSIPLPGPIFDLASMFRSSGRFFWPVMYSLAALSIIAVVPRFGPRGTLLLLAAAVLQWVDAAPLRTDLMASIRTPAPPHIDLAAWREAIAHHAAVRLLPPYACQGDGWQTWDQEVAIQLQLLAAEADVPINTVYAGRYKTDCAAAAAIEGEPVPGSRMLSVYVREFTGFARMQALAASNPACRAAPGLVVCSDIDAQSDRLADLVRTDAQ
jgi:hypothetical protein